MVPGMCARLISLVLAASICLGTGCTGVKQYVHNKFKVGPDYHGVDAAVAETWIDAKDVRIQPELRDLSRWWSVFRDPVLDGLVESAQNQNLSLREAGFRVLAARAQLGIATGNIFPQTQNAAGNYRHVNTPVGTPTQIVAGLQGVTMQVTDPLGTHDVTFNNNVSFPLVSQNSFFDQWNLGFNLAWELDFWGRFRRAIAAAEDSLDASAANYDDVLVTMLGDVATNYVAIRTLETRLEFVRQNVEEQRKIVAFQKRVYENGLMRKGRPRLRKYDIYQLESVLAQTEAAIPQLEIQLREAGNRLCVLLGLPPRELQQELGKHPIPAAPAEVVVGIPADLLRRRPDIRRAERQLAAQAEQIGIAETDLYPAFSIVGTLAYQANDFGNLFGPNAFNSSLGPSFQWNILNYGRIRNNMRLQDAKFQELWASYQRTVLLANAEVENGLVRFVRAQERARSLDASVDFAEKTLDEIKKAEDLPDVDANQIAVVAQNKVQQQDLQAQAHGEIAQGLIQVYRALGGGWEAPTMAGEPPLVTPLQVPGPEELPAPPRGGSALPEPAAPQAEPN